MYPYPQPFPVRSAPIWSADGSRFLPFFGVPFLAGLAGGLIGGALAFGPRPPYYPPYPSYPSYPPSFPCYGNPCQPYY